MPKITLEYQLPEEQETYETIMQAGAMSSSLWDISNEVFRKAIKYNSSSNERLQELLNNPETQELSLEVVGLLREEFHRVLEEHGVDAYA